MNIFCRGTATIVSKDDGQAYSIAADELDWQNVSADERQMGTEIQRQAELDHPDLGPLTWSLWEYPEGVQNHSETNARGHTVTQDFDYGLEHAPEQDR